MPLALPSEFKKGFFMGRAFVLYGIVCCVTHFYVPNNVQQFALPATQPCLSALVCKPSKG